MSDELDCICPKGRPLTMPHLTGCPMKAPEDNDNVIAMRGADGRPLGIPADIVIKVERSYAAYMDRLDGMTWEAIAAKHDWPTAAAASAEVKTYLEEGRAALSAFKRAETIQVWRDRLEVLWTAVIPAAKEGKVPSVMAALSVAKTAMTLEGLDKPSEDDITVQTVVIPSDEYIAQLRAIGKGESEAS